MKQERGLGRQPDFRLPTSLHTSFTDELTALFSNQRSSCQTSYEVANYKLAWQSQNFLSKFSGEGTASAVERRDAAIAKWLLMERRNRRTNERLILSNPDFGSVRGSDILSFARMVVRQIIGRSPPSDILFGGFTNGASTRIKRGPTAIAQKYVGEAHVTQSALPHLRKVMEESALWVTEYFNQEFVPIVVPGSVLFTVPMYSA